MPNSSDPAPGSGDPTPTRERIVAVAMDLFGRQGYHATTVAQIEAAAGLAGGAGGLYRHYPSKRALLERGLRRQFEAGQGLLAFLGDPAALADLPLRDQLLAVARAGLRRLEQERDVNRLLLRDLAGFPDLLDEVRRHELRGVFDALVGWLGTHPGGGDVDRPAVAAVLMAAVSHYWVLSDVFAGAHPHEIDAERFLGALCEMAAAVLTRPGESEF